MEKRLEEALKGLVQTVRQIENLSAWLELERSERRTPSGAWLQWNSSTEQDLKAEIGAFLNSFFDILEVMGRTRDDGSAGRAKERLRKIYKRFEQAAAPMGL
jgi:hypothetical protein